MNQRLETQRATSLKTQLNAVTTAYGSLFARAATVFRDGPRLLAKFQQAVENAIQNSDSSLSAVHEICMAGVLLELTTPLFASLTYEPPFANTAKTIDFSGTTPDGTRWFVDVKSIMPRPTNAWPQFSRAVGQSWVRSSEFMLSEEFAGGEIWHDTVTARSRMLEHALDLESKIALSGLQGSSTEFALAFCGSGFEWAEHELYDFVSFYFSARHRSDDVLGRAEANSMNVEQVSLARSIQRFVCMHREKMAVRPKFLRWYRRPEPAG